MSAIEDWNSISSDPEFRKQPISVQNTVTNNFFNRHIAPNVPPEHLDEVKKSFYADAFKSIPQDQVTTGGAAKEAFMQTMKGDVPVLGKIAEAVRTTIPEYVAGKGEQFGLPKTGAAIGAGISTAGELIPKRGWELGAQVAAEPVTMLTKALGARAALPIISFLTQIEMPVVKRAISRVGVLANKELLAPDAVEKAIAGLGESIKSNRRALGQRLGAITDKIADKVTTRVPIADIGAELGSKLSKKGYSVAGQSAGEISRGLHPQVAEILEDLSKKDLSFRDAANLKSKIGDMVSWENKKLLGISDQMESTLKTAYGKLNDRLRVAGPRYAFANDAFSKAAKVYDELASDVLSGKPETIQRRITAMFNKGSAERKIVEKVEKISQDAGESLDKILDSITAGKFQPGVSPAVLRASTHTGGGVLGASGVGGAVGAAAAMGHPVYAAGVGATLAATSPKLHALALRAALSPIGMAELKGLPPATVAAVQALMRSRQDNKNGQ